MGNSLSRTVHTARRESRRCRIRRCRNFRPLEGSRDKYLVGPTFCYHTNLLSHYIFDPGNQVYILTAIPRLEAPYFHIAVRKVDWGNRLLQFYCVNWSTKSCFSILLYSREICCGSFSHAPSAAFIGIGSTVHSIHPILVRPAAVTRGPAWCSGKPLNQPT